MTIDIATVNKIARLARLKVPEAEKQQVAGELSKIVQWVEQLNEVDVSGIEPLTSVNDKSLRSRADVVSDGNCPEDILSNAPSRVADFFAVPKVIE